MNKAYERETEMWNQVFKECTPVDLRNLDLQVETMFDEALKLFAQNNKCIRFWLWYRRYFFSIFAVSAYT